MRYTLDEVSIEGGYPVNKILDISMDAQANHHGYLTYTGVVSEDTATQFIQQPAKGQSVKVFLRNKLEFYGYLHKVVVEQQNEHCLLKVTLASGSQLMDNTPRFRFFQDKKRTFSQILTEAYRDSGFGNIMSNKGNVNITYPILQYNETDWQFTLRMAGRLQTVVIPDITSDSHLLMLGIPKRQIYKESNSQSYTICRSTAEYLHKNFHYNYVGYQNYPYNLIELKEAEYGDFLYYRLKSSNRYRLGDRISIDRTTFTVMRKSLLYNQGIIDEIYVLGQEHDFAVPFFHNKSIAGLELEGTVIGLAGKDIELDLDIDAGRKTHGNTWFGYAPITNNGMYSIPLKGEKAVLQWQSELDHDANVIRPVRKNSLDMPRPIERHFLTEHENHMMMVPNEIAFANPVGNIEMLTQSGFHISSAKEVLLIAHRDIEIHSKSQIQAYSPERITVTKTYTDSSIDMLSNELHITAVEKVRALSKANNYKKSILPKKMPDMAVDASIAAKIAAACPHIGNSK